MAIYKTAQQYLDSAAPDEPVFLLMGRDPLAAQVVQYWAWLAEMKRLHSREKIDLAITHAERLQAWADYKRTAASNVASMQAS